MTAKAITANSAEGQLEQLIAMFAGVQKSARNFEAQDRKVRDYLFKTLAELYTFGEALLGPQHPGVNMVRAFLVSQEVPYSKPIAANPYIGLVKLAFPNVGDPSRSQYATVLGYASSLGLPTGGFFDWLKEGGIEKRRSEALDANASAGRSKSVQRQQTRLTFARNTLDAKPASEAVALPSGIQAPKGFALVLAKVDGSNNAQIVEVLQTDPAKVDPILLSLVEQPKAASAEPLAPFLRAVDLILETTPDKIKGNDRHLLVRSQRRLGKAITTIEAVSEAYSFPGASMSLAGHFGALPENTAFILKVGDARNLIKATDTCANWKIDATGALSADELTTPIQMEELTEPGSYRVVEALPCPAKPLRTLSSTLEGVVGYIEHERSDLKRKNGSARQPSAFPTFVSLSVQDTRLSIKLPSSGRVADLGETGADAAFDDVTLAVADVEAVAKTLAKQDIEASGWIMDSPDMDDAALVLEMHFDNDLFRIVMPTRTGSDYNQVCKALAL